MKKRLAKIPYDLVPYIQIETEAISDSNDKMMISSYCLGKLKTVEWYIALLENGSLKYEVPHTLSELQAIRSQLQECHRQIMQVKIKKRPLIDLDYPKGYEG